MSDRDAAIEIENVSYRYGSREALRSVGFECRPGEFCALLGLNGAGKSTLIALLSRLLVPSAGRIVISGNDLAVRPRAALARLGIVFQQPTLDLDLTVAQNLTYFAGLHGLSGASVRTEIERALDRLELRDSAGETVRTLSGGFRRRVEISRSLIHKPTILVLDEPTVGLDAATRAAITDHVHRLARDSGLTVLWTTHLVDEIWPEDTLVVLHRGRVLAHDLAGAIAGDRPLADAFLAMTSDTA